MQAATLLTSLFPTWTPVVSGSVELCKECEKTQESADEKTQEMSAMCKKEKVRPLLPLDRAPKLTPSAPTDSPSSSPLTVNYRLVSSRAPSSW